MHWVIDILAIIVLLFFFMKGWQRGILLSLLGVARILVSLLVAFLVGKYLGGWLANHFYRPRLITIPACGITAFSLVAFLFRIAIIEVHERQKDKAKRDEFKLPILSRLSGGVVSTASSMMALVLLFWMTDVFLAGFFGTSIPGSAHSTFATAERRAIYEASYSVNAREGKESQAAAMAQMISNPNKGFEVMEKVLEAESVRGFFTDPEFAKDFLSGDAARIEQSLTMQAFMEDTETQQRLYEIGILPRNKEERTPAVLSQKMADVGATLQEKMADEKIQICIQQLKDEKMLSADKIPELVRDGRFHIIIDGLIK